jgi:hypothetical protein
MRRREFITLLSGAAAWVSPARAQEPRRVIGSLGSGSSDTWARAVTAFVQGLKDTGFIEGNNISIEWRWAADQYSRLPSLAGELVSRRVAVIACFDTPSAFAAKAATGTTFIDRKAFLAQIGRGSSVKNIREHDVIVRILGDFAIIHGRASYPEGRWYPGGRPLHR